MAPPQLKTQDPTTATPHPESTLPAYDDEGSAATAAGERAPFIRPEDIDVEAQPPAYEADASSAANANANANDADAAAFEKQSLSAKILSVTLGMVLFMVGFGGILTLGVVFLKLLVQDRKSVV